MTDATFAGRLQTLREAAGLSQAEVARRTGLTRQTLSRLEKADGDPTWSTVRLLAQVLGVSVTAFEIGTVKLPANEGRPKPSPAPKRKATPAKGKKAGRKGTK